MTPAEFTTIYREHLPQVAKYLVRRCNRDDVEELASKTFEIAWLKREQVAPGHELPWLYRIAGYVLANHRRALARNQSFLASLWQRDYSPSPEDIAIADLSLAEAWRKLSPAERQLLALVSFEGLDNAQLAIALELSPNAVAVRLARARAKLAQYLAE